MNVIGWKALSGLKEMIGDERYEAMVEELKSDFCETREFWDCVANEAMKQIDVCFASIVQRDGVFGVGVMPAPDVDCRIEKFFPLPELIEDFSDSMHEGYPELTDIEKKVLTDLLYRWGGNKKSERTDAETKTAVDGG